MVRGKLRAPFEDGSGNPRFRDIDGKIVALQELCREYLVLFCTFKMVACPVCPEQLRRLFRGDLGAFFEEAKVKFVVLCPGPVDALRASRRELLPSLHGRDVIFICDENLSIARGINAAKGGQIIPCFFEVLPDLKLGWTQVGRGPGNFGDYKVIRFVEDEMAGSIAIAERSFADLRGCLARLRRCIDEQRSRYLEAQAKARGDGPCAATDHMVEVHELPPGILESCTEWLAEADAMKASRASREWWLCAASAGEQKVSAQMEAWALQRDGENREKEARQRLLEGRGALQQWVLVPSAAGDCFTLGTIAKLSADNYTVQIRCDDRELRSQKVQEFPHGDVQVPPWWTLSIPERLLAARQMQERRSHIRTWAISMRMLRKTACQGSGAAAPAPFAPRQQNEQPQKRSGWGAVVVLAAAALAAVPALVTMPCKWSKEVAG